MKGKKPGKTLHCVENRENGYGSALILGDDRAFQACAGAAKMALGKEGIIEATGLKPRSQAGFPGIVLDPAAPRPFPKGLPDIRREELNLPNAILSGHDGQYGREKSPPKELYLLPSGHLLKEHEKFRMARLKPTQGRTGIIENGRDIRKAIEG
jgi:hypothetical protein